MMAVAERYVQSFSGDAFPPSGVPLKNEKLVFGDTPVQNEVMGYREAT